MYKIIQTITTVTTHTAIADKEGKEVTPVAAVGNEAQTTIIIIIIDPRKMFKTSYQTIISATAVYRKRGKIFYQTTILITRDFSHLSKQQARNSITREITTRHRILTKATLGHRATTLEADYSHNTISKQTGTRKTIITVTETEIANVKDIGEIIKIIVTLTQAIKTYSKRRTKHKPHNKAR